MQARPWHANYDEGVQSEIDYEPLTVVDFLERGVRDHPHAPALYFLNCEMTYGELGEAVRRFARALVDLGVTPGASVAIQLPNLPQTVIAYYGALRAGAKVVLTNPLYTAREIEHQWNDAECVVAVTADFLWDRVVRDLRPQLSVEHFIVASIPEYLRFPLSWLAPFKLKRQDPPVWAKVKPEPGLSFFRKLVEATPDLPPQAPTTQDDIAVLQYTGGTTGVSKAAVLTHRNLSVNVQQCSNWFPPTEPAREVVMTCLPIFHVFGMTVCMNWAIHSTGAMVLIPNPRDVKSLVQAVAKHRVTVFPGVPALYNSMNNYPGIEDVDLSSVKGCLSGSAPIPPDVLQRFESLTGSKIVEGFGMSETSPLTHANPFLGERRLGSIGLPVSDTDARIVDVEDPSVVLGVGEEGELALHGPQVMQGYWKRQDETDKTLVDGWLLTGDLGTMDADGYFRIVGRKKDMISCGGLKVFPDEVDAILMAHDSILEAATIGVPDEKRGETVKSFIVLQPGKKLDEAEIEAYCRENMAAYKIPREVEFLDELPKSTVLKVLRRELRDRELAKRRG